jgi:DNA topoisomerase III
MGKTILQRAIPREQVVKISETGKTDLIAGFVSKKGRKFAAYLKLDGKKVGFEFEPREPKAPGAAKGRFGKPVKPNLTTEAVTAKVEKSKKAPAKTAAKSTAKKVVKPKKASEAAAT